MSRPIERPGNLYCINVRRTDAMHANLSYAEACELSDALSGRAGVGRWIIARIYAGKVSRDRTASGAYVAGRTPHSITVQSAGSTPMST